MDTSVTETSLTQFSLGGFFASADFLTQIVTIIMIFGSVWCWAIIFEKWSSLRRLNRMANDFEDSFWSGGSLEALYDRVGKRPRDPMSAIFAAGMNEWRVASSRSLKKATTSVSMVEQRIERSMNIAISKEMNRIEGSMIVLATIASVSPLLGLFGTVWGVIDSFSSIAGTNVTSLSAVAPGIAKALFTTALGLIAAIPAVVAYNQFSNALGKYEDRLEAFSTEFGSILSRHLEDRNDEISPNAPTGAAA